MEVAGTLNGCLVRFISTTPYRPCEGSSYIPTPYRLSNKKCTINIQNEDELCFLYCILAQIHPAGDNRERVSKYKPYLHTLNIEGLTFPMQVRNVGKFEKLNPDISVNVLYFNDHDEDAKDRRRDHTEEMFVSPFT